MTELQALIAAYEHGLRVMRAKRERIAAEHDRARVRDHVSALREAQRDKAGGKP
jgi:hypothetical protein